MWLVYSSTVSLLSFSFSVALSVIASNDDLSVPMGDDVDVWNVDQDDVGALRSLLIMPDVRKPGSTN